MITESAGQARPDIPETLAGPGRSEQPSPKRSLLRSSPAYVALAIAIANANNFADPDLWMHILVGERILRAAHIPPYDFYSYSAAGLPWRHHALLSQLTLALSYDVLGVFGLKLVKLLCAAVIVVSLAAGLARTAASVRVQRLVLVAAAAGIAGQMQFRPQLFSFVLLSILMAVLAQYCYRGRARLWPLIPMFGLWANLHGAFVTGLVALLIVSVVIACRELIVKGRIERAWGIASVTAACFLVTLINPLGVNLWRNVLHSVSDTVVKSYIRDWIPLLKYIAYNWGASRLDDIQYIVPLGLFAGFLFVLADAPVLEDAPLAAVALFFVAAAFYSSRNIPLGVITLCIPLAHHAAHSLAKHRTSHARRAQTGPSPALIAAAAVMIALVAGELSGRLQTGEPVPSGAVAFIKKHRLGGNVLNELGWGGYLVWHAAPRIRIFVDGRCEVVYPDSVLRDYLGFFYGWPGAAKILERYPHDLILVKPGTGAYRIARGDPRWKVVYRDPVSVLFAKASAPLDQVTAVSASDDPPSSSSLFP